METPPEEFTAISVDYALLARILGIVEWPETLKAKEAKLAIGYRIITDGYRADSPPSLVMNIQPWVKELYQMGYAKGVVDTDEKWWAKIKKLFS